MKKALKHLSERLKDKIDLCELVEVLMDIFFLGGAAFFMVSFSLFILSKI